MNAFGDWLRRKYLEWQLADNKLKTIVQFAEYLEVSQPSLTEWMSGKYIPKGHRLARIAEKLGYEVYDVLQIPRPTSVDVNEHLANLVRAASNLPTDVQDRITAALQRMTPLVLNMNITDSEQIMWYFADVLRDQLDHTSKPEKMAAELLGIPPTAYPVGVTFQFERTPENMRKSKEAAIQAAKKLEELGLDEDSEEGQKVILDVFLQAGLPVLDTSGMNFDIPDELSEKE